MGAIRNRCPAFSGRSTNEPLTGTKPKVGSARSRYGSTASMENRRAATTPPACASHDFPAPHGLAWINQLGRPVLDRCQLVQYLPSLAVRGFPASLSYNSALRRSAASNSRNRLASSLPMMAP
jgi:hypothetical protein